MKCLYCKYMIKYDKYVYCNKYNIYIINNTNCKDNIIKSIGNIIHDCRKCIYSLREKHDNMYYTKCIVKNCYIEYPLVNAFLCSNYNINLKEV